MEEYLKKLLNEQQYEAAVYCNGPSLILAGAGSGKTRTLTYKIAYIVSNGVSPSNILAVTFTNKAANEMKERLREIAKEIGEDQPVETEEEDVMPDFDDLVSNTLKATKKTTKSKGKNALQNSRLFRIGTFHSIFLKILKEDIEHLNDIIGSKYTKNFNILDQGDSLTIFRDIMKKHGIKDSFTPKELKGIISKAKNNGLSAKDYLYQAKDQAEESIGKVFQAYEKELQKINSLDFDDLLYLPFVLFSKNTEILNKWKDKFEFVLVDEAQDTNMIQFQTILMLSGNNGNITLIGDDFQSIYGWRGAVIEEFLAAQKHWPEIKIFKLEINYRSNKTIVNAGNYIIANNKKQFKKNIVAANTKENKVGIIKFDNDSDEAIQIINLIKNFKEKKQKEWKNFAILYRTNAQSKPFEDILLTEKIPYKIWGAFKFFERREVKDIIAYVKYIANIDTFVSLERIINVPSRKIGKTSIDKIKIFADENNISLQQALDQIDMTPLGPSTKTNIKGFNSAIKYLKSQLENNTPAQFINNILSQIRYEAYLKKEFGDEDTRERMENIGQLINSASMYDTTGAKGIGEFIDDISLLVELEADQKEGVDAVQLMTVHSSKGLEFDTVFIAGLEENIFPLAKAAFESDQLEEERRLMYVAVTRAKNFVFVTYAESRRQYGSLRYNSPSRFIDEIPTHISTSYNTPASDAPKQDFKLHNKVRHKLFGDGEIIEIFQDVAIVRFFGGGMKRIDVRYLEKLSIEK